MSKKRKILEEKSNTTNKRPKNLGTKDAICDIIMDQEDHKISRISGLLRNDFDINSDSQSLQIALKYALDNEDNSIAYFLLQQGINTNRYLLESKYTDLLDKLENQLKQEQKETSSIIESIDELLNQNLQDDEITSPIATFRPISAQNSGNFRHYSR